MWTNRNRGWSVERAREPPPGTGRGTQVRARALLFHAHLGLLFLLLRATARRTSRPRAMLTGDRRNSGREVSGTRDPPAGTGARTERTSNSSSSRARGRGPTAGGGGGVHPRAALSFDGFDPVHGGRGARHEEGERPRLWAGRQGGGSFLFGPPERAAHGPNKQILTLLARPAQSQRRKQPPLRRLPSPSPRLSHTSPALLLAEEIPLLCSLFSSPVVCPDRPTHTAHPFKIGRGEHGRAPKTSDAGAEGERNRREGGTIDHRTPGGAGGGAYMGVEAGGCGRRAVVTGFYVWGWEFLTALLLFSAAASSC